MKILNNKGPKIDTCGTPHNILLHKLYLSFIFTLYFLFEIILILIKARINIFPGKCNSIVNNDKLSRSESETQLSNKLNNKYTPKQTKICNKK